MLATAACLLVAYCTWNYVTKLKRVNYLPGMRPPLSALSAFGALIPTCWWNPGLDWPWLWRKTIYFNYRHEVISMVPFIGDPVFYTCSLSVMKQLLKDDSKLGLIKPPDMMASLCIWGENLVSANGNVWKRHRRILGPSFTNTTYDLVWRQSAALYEEMVRAGKWENKETVSVRNICLYTRNFALTIISRCGFGLSMPWKDPSTEEVEQEMSFAVALEWVSTTSIPRLVLPRWSYRLPIKWLRDMDYAWSMLAAYMNRFIETKAQELSGLTDGGKDIQHGDVFTRLVLAMDGTSKTGLEKQEVIGNTFMLMFTGHETTANVLAATLGFLAIHQDEQEKAYQEILAVASSSGELGAENVAKLTHTLACFYESARIYPAGNVVPRDPVDSDVAVNVTSPSPGTIVFPKGSRIILDMVAIHHNPNTFPDPDVWQPSRWYGVSEHDLSMFGVGPRACVGRKFAQIEVACFLVHLLRDWRLDVELGDGETREQYESRVMGNARFAGLAFGVGPVDLKLVARK